MVEMYMTFRFKDMFIVVILVLGICLLIYDIYQRNIVLNIRNAPAISNDDIYGVNLQDFVPGLQEEYMRQFRELDNVDYVLDRPIS